MVEIMVVVVIISVLMGIVYFNVSDSTAQSRDAQRQADLRNLQAAIEAYKFDNGRYPERCAVTGESWSGQIGTDYECNNGTNEYIIGLAPKYIRSLPVDPKLNGDDSGYVYTVNTEGTVYKVMAKNTVHETVTVGHAFQSCDRSNAGSTPFACKPPVSGRKCNIAMCDMLFNGNRYNSTKNTHLECGASNAQFQSSYAVWGGYATPSASFTPGTEQYSANMERLTEDIVCKI